MIEKTLDLRKQGKLVGKEDTFTANIYVGCLDDEKGFERPVAEVKAFCQDFVEQRGLCVHVQEVFYQYGNGEGEGGNERGAKIGLIQYPRFPKEESEIKEIALNLAEKLMHRMRQKRVSVVASDTTITLQNPSHPEVETK